MVVTHPWSLGVDGPSIGNGDVNITISNCDGNITAFSNGDDATDVDKLKNGFAHNGTSVREVSRNMTLPILPRNYDRYSEVFGHQRSPSMEFKELTKKDAQVQLTQELQKLLLTCPESHKPITQLEFEGFENLFGRFINETGPSLEWDNIQKLPDGSVCDYKDLSGIAEGDIKTMLDKIVVIKLNGGLGTSMGCHGPKSIIPVRSQLTFLDLTVQQIENLNKTYNSNVPLVLMNSFNTDEDTQKVIRKYQGFQLHSYKTLTVTRRPFLLLLKKNPEMVNPDIEWYYFGQSPNKNELNKKIKIFEIISKFKQKKRYNFANLSRISHLRLCSTKHLGNYINVGTQTSARHQNMALNDEGVNQPQDITDVKSTTNPDRVQDSTEVPAILLGNFMTINQTAIFSNKNLFTKMHFEILTIFKAFSWIVDAVLIGNTITNALSDQAISITKRSFDICVILNI
ncbi:unnamed protein product, partial [Meganyctiphanes norvegica]